MGQCEGRTLSLEGIKAQLDDLMGKILTTVDASVVDPIQRKAVKDIMKHEFYRKMDWIYQLANINEEDLAPGNVYVVKIASKVSK